MSISGKVTLLADNQIPAFTPTSEATGFEATNLIDGNETTIYKPTGFTDQVLTYDQGSALISSFDTSVFDASSTITTGISYAPNGTLWVCDSTTNKIYNIETDGTLISSFANSVFDASSINVQGVSFAADGTLWVCDATTNKVYNIETDGTLISSFATSVFDGSATVPTGISFAANGTLWVCDNSTDKVYNIETDGTLISSFANSVFDASSINVQGVSFAADGTLWVCDVATDKIYNIKVLLAFDSLFLSGHNLNTVGAEILWQYSDDGSAWNDINYPFVPTDNKSIGVRLSSMRTTRAVRVTLSNMTALPYISTLIITQKSEFEYANLYDPHRTKKNRNVNKTLHGQVSDITTYYDERILSLSFDNVTDAGYKVVKKYFDNNSADIVGVYWEPENHMNDIWPMTLDSDELNAPYVVSGVLRSVSIRLRGVKE